MRYPKFMYVINKIGAYFCGIYTLVISALAVMESILRKVFASPTTWTLNLSTGLFIWAAFLGSSWAFQELGHVSVDLIRNLVDSKSKSESRKPRRIMAIIGYIISFIVMCAFLYGGWFVTSKSINPDGTFALATYAFKFPLIISYLAIIVGSIQMMLTLLFIVLDLIAGGDKYL